MKLKFLAPPVSLAILLFGLAYVDAAELTDVSTRAPQKVDLPENFTDRGNVSIVGYTTLADPCEAYAGYDVEVGVSEVIIDSFISTTEELCAQVIIPAVPQRYEIHSLVPDRVYQIFFRQADGTLVKVGSIRPPTPLIL